VPVGFSRAAASEGGVAGRVKPQAASGAGLAEALVGAADRGRQRAPVRRLGERIRPDLVHALRLPLEGMLAAEAGLAAPLPISLWGNDLTLHAPPRPSCGGRAGARCAPPTA
jgi:hypothetical protein